MVKIGIIGGSGLDDPGLLDDYEEKEVETPYGRPSSKIICGKISEVEVCILARHGKKHEIPPSLVNYRANILALKMLGCSHILATSAVGSLRDEIKPGNLVFPSQFIDFTKQRKSSFFDEVGEVKHSSMAEPYDKKIRDLLCKVCDELGFKYNKDKTIITIEGPRFSTKAESHMFRQWGADVVNMSSCPEVILASEIGLSYQTIAMSTDYDCWKENEDPVTWEMILKRMNENADKVKQLLLIAIPRVANADSDFIKNKIRTVPNWPKQGVMFRDITTLLNDVDGMNRVMEILYNRYKDKNIEIVAGIESRGFIIGAVLANKLNIGFVPIRKKGKLPYEVVREEYALEYGTDCIEVHKDAIKYKQKVLIVDDLIATGGTLLAACNLVKKLGGEVIECASIIDLPELKGSEKIKKGGFEVFTIVEFGGE
jgi:5'-methylthioadenosine phosphorylase